MLLKRLSHLWTSRERRVVETDHDLVEWFDRDYYVSHNPDVAEAQVDPFWHYLDHGRREGRAGSARDEANAGSVRRFDARFYLTAYPDVAAAGVDPLGHFVDHGLREGRQGSPMDEDPPWPPGPDRLTLADDGSISLVSARSDGQGGQAAEAGSRATPTAEVGEAVGLSVLMSVQDLTLEHLVASVNSIFDQSHETWEVILDADGSGGVLDAALARLRGLHDRIHVLERASQADRAAQLNAFVSRASLVVVTNGADRLAPHALRHFAKAAADHDRASLFYGDEEFVDADGVLLGEDFKPDWSPEHLESGMYLASCLAMPRTEFLRLGGLRTGFSEADMYDLALRVLRDAGEVIHIPRVLSRRLSFSPPAGRHEEQAAAPFRAALRAHLAASSRNAVVEDGAIARTYRVREAIPSGLRVTLAIFTDNRQADLPGRGEVNLFDHFVQSIVERTHGACRYEILAVDNRNLTKRQHAMLEARGGRVASFDHAPGAPFNFARKANFGLSHVETEIVVLLNDDMEVISPGWLDALVELAGRPAIGAVGARLLFPDDTIQHCGIVCGIGNDVAHALHRFPASRVGYSGITHRIRNYSAVTGACLATRMSIVKEVGGFDVAFEIDYNDVDFCLRVADAGYRNVYTPFASLYHFEGQTERRMVSRPADQKLFRKRWAHRLGEDPYYNRNLSRTTADFSCPSRAVKRGIDGA